MAYLPKAAAGLTLAALIGASAASQATIVQFQTVMGDFEVNLYDETTPETVANFLAYVEAGAYSDTFMHRSVPGFIVQGGGFNYDIENAEYGDIASNDPVMNEPLLSNQRGTIAMAKPSEKPNGATNQWFFNLKDNSVSLDGPEGGYTVFGEVAGNGMAIIDAMAELPRGNFTPEEFINNIALDEMPVRDYEQEDYDDNLLPTEDHIVLVQNIVVLDAAVDTAADLDPMPTTRDDSEPDNGGNNGGSGGGGGSVSWLMLLGLLGAGIARRVSRQR
ncbi:peptidylprolyl isomerase [Gilvimarinus agarilyticus]|uniref:peptidylprolyl isomerase n=1 Tax=Gilvimarinus agarilyticus TaxID=679259 RepID=UPI0005A06ADA|nr:peptidylprolyl isomerase [Gilvimarinus agarilyticus]